jgi:hypothetical protein
VTATSLISSFFLFREIRERVGSERDRKRERERVARVEMERERERKKQKGRKRMENFFSAIAIETESSRE